MWPYLLSLQLCFQVVPVHPFILKPLLCPLKLTAQILQLIFINLQRNREEHCGRMNSNKTPSPLDPHFCCMLVGLLLQSRVGPLLSEKQVLFGQLQVELGHLQPGLVQLSVGVILTSAQLLQLSAQTLNHKLIGFQALLQSLHRCSRSLNLHLFR